jgi:membrane-bound metal-dependent hydrolase YbcI (DUF457 family)
VPITPFHFGPGAALHALAPRRVSFLGFCAANVLVDVEPLYFLLTEGVPAHRAFHTLIGATAVAAATVLAYAATRAVAIRIRLPDLFGWRSLTTPQVVLGAALGAWSHIALDSLMHGDIRPLAPFSDANPLLHAVELGTLHWACVAAGVGGLLVLGLRRLARRRAASRARARPAGAS